VWNFLRWLHAEKNDEKRFELNLKYASKRFGVSMDEVKEVLRYLDALGTLDLDEPRTYKGASPLTCHH
jgi:hypothetical protein